MVRLFWLMLLSLAAISARAETAEKAFNAAIADTASTAAALSSNLNLVELNPVGVAGAIVVKVATMVYVGQLPEEDRALPYSVASSVWGGAAANNLCLLSGAGPLCLVLGIVTGRYLWGAGEEGRKFWASCKSQRLTSPNASCGLAPLGQPPEAQLASTQAP